MDNNEYYEIIGKLLNEKYMHKALNDLTRAVAKHIEKMEYELAELKAEKRTVKKILETEQTASKKLEAIKALLEDKAEAIKKFSKLYDDIKDDEVNAVSWGHNNGVAILTDY